MADNSDTESDSESLVLANAEDILSHAAFSASPEPRTISQIIQTLLDQPLIPFQREEIEADLSILIHFSDNISSRLKDDADVLEVLNSFAFLGMSIN